MNPQQIINQIKKEWETYQKFLTQLRLKEKQKNQELQRRLFPRLRGHKLDIRPVRKSKSQEKCFVYGCNSEAHRYGNIQTNLCKAHIGLQSSESAPSSSMAAQGRQETTIGGSCVETGSYADTQPSQTVSQPLTNSWQSTMPKVGTQLKN